MIVKVINTIDKCPSECDDAKITVDTMERPFFSKSEERMRVIIDCVHSGVCKFRDDGDAHCRNQES